MASFENLELGLTFKVEPTLIEVESTPAQRLKALQDAKELMTSGNGGVFTALTGTNSPGKSEEAINGFIRLAEYITTGHEYRDTHPAVDPLIIDGTMTEQRVRKIVKRQIKKAQQN